MINEVTDKDLFEHLKSSCPEDWHDYIRHPFVLNLADGSLREESFRHYLTQDYVFLKHFSRAWALAVYKADTLQDMKEASAILDGLLNQEMALHIEYCQAWGIEPETIEATTEARANMAYTRYVLDAGMSGDLLDLLVALAPCVVGYAEIAEERMADTETQLSTNPYSKWLETYAADDYQQLATQMKRQLNTLAAQRATTARLPALKKHFLHATRLEQDFWTMGLDCSF